MGAFIQNINTNNIRDMLKRLPPSQNLNTGLDLLCGLGSNLRIGEAIPLWNSLGGGE